MKRQNLKHKHMTSVQIIILGFLSVIISGSIRLMFFGRVGGLALIFAAMAKAAANAAEYPQEKITVG